jgi:4a-hydroxytetrahydrobiopterin dehydratase
MWDQSSNKLYKCFTFKDFSETFAFMTRVAFIAEQKNHHPVWKNEYNKLEIWLCTHDEGNVVTLKDEEMAKAIDELMI